MTYHVSPYTPRPGSRKDRLDHRWQVKHEGSDRASATGPTKKGMISRARGMAARHTGKNIIVHRADGTTQYGLENAGTKKSPNWVRS